jgi:hypothetical protein
MLTKELKDPLLRYLMATITNGFETFVHDRERKLCADNGTPNGFMFKHMTFREHSTNLAFTCKPELEDAAYEVWELKVKLKRDMAVLKCYFRSVLASISEPEELYAYVPKFMHLKLDSLFSEAVIAKKVEDTSVKNEAIFNLISFYVMSKLII